MAAPGDPAAPTPPATPIEEAPSAPAPAQPTAPAADPYLASFAPAPRHWPHARTDRGRHLRGACRRLAVRIAQQLVADPADVRTVASKVLRLWRVNAARIGSGNPDVPTASSPSIAAPAPVGQQHRRVAGQRRQHWPEHPEARNGYDRDERPLRWHRARRAFGGVMTALSSFSTVLWIGLALGVVVTLLMPLAGLVVLAVVAVVAQVRGLPALRTVALVVLLAALLVVLFGPVGGEGEGGLID